MFIVNVGIERIYLMRLISMPTTCSRCNSSRDTNLVIVSISSFISLKPERFISIFLNKDPKTLATEKRPLSQNGGVMKLYEERMPVYRSFKDLEIKVSDDADITFKDLMNKLF